METRRSLGSGEPSRHSYSNEYKIGACKIPDYLKPDFLPEHPKDATIFATGTALAQMPHLSYLGREENKHTNRIRLNT